MTDNRAKASEYSYKIKNLNGALDRDMLNGELGVFACSWKNKTEQPQNSGNYLVIVRTYEPVIALYIKDLGWDLSDTQHIGLEAAIRCWMDLPKAPK